MHASMTFLFRISVPRDPAFVAPLRDLAGRVAQFAGYDADEAGRIGKTVHDSAVTAIRTAPAAGSLDIRFDTSDGTFDVTLAFDSTAGGEAFRPARGAMDEVSLAREGNRTICRLSRKLPDVFSA
jgi:hypothetical protein